MATAVSSHDSTKVRTREIDLTHAASAVAYAAIVVGTYLTFGFLYYYAAYEKLITDSGTMPAPLAKTFAGSFIASFPGTNVAWVLIGIVEATVAIGLVASLLTGEFLPSRHKPLLLSSLGISMVALGALAFGENMTGGFATVAELFSYFTGTAVIIVLILLMPPYRRTRWLSNLSSRSTHE
jgi:hypothetical protein